MNNLVQHQGERLVNLLKIDERRDGRDETGMKYRDYWAALLVGRLSIASSASSAAASSSPSLHPGGKKTRRHTACRSIVT